MHFVRLGLAFLIALAGATVAWGHDDVVPYESEGKIVTGGHDDGALTDNITQRVYGYDFGEDPLDPYFITDPGFNNGGFAAGLYPNDGLLPPGATLRFDMLTNLLYWDGTGGVAFGIAPADVELGLRRGSNTVLVSGTGQSGTAPSIGTTGASGQPGAGRLHEHLESQLNYTDGTDPTAPNAPDGIYLVGIQLKILDSGLTNSDPIYLLYNNNLNEEVHDEAIDWANATLVPEPATWLTMMIATAAALAVGWRRRRRSA